jgi:hypothetical protein
MSPEATSWEALVAGTSIFFTQPSGILFRQLVTAWVLWPGRHTVTGMLRTRLHQGGPAHDAFHRLVRAGAWRLCNLWSSLARSLVRTFYDGEPVIPLDLDDTLFHKSGRKVEGAGIFRDAVRSTGQRVVYALGLNVVVLTLRVCPPWGGEPLGLPINTRLFRKGGPTRLELARAMIVEVASWFPLLRFRLACDGAYASLAGEGLPRTHVTSRLRRDAALYELPPPRKKGRPGRPRKKGRRLPSPERLAQNSTVGWRRAIVNERGKSVTRLLLARPVLWYQVCRDRPVLLVVVRDPEGRQHDDFFFSTDLQAAPEAVAGHYAGRWSIEDTFRNDKQLLGAEHPQTWRNQGPERATAIALWIYSAVWMWYIPNHGARPSWPQLPWYPKKKTPSFADALARLRRALWQSGVFAGSTPRPLLHKIPGHILHILAYAA